MTDKEIEKALNICSRLESDACNECPIDGKIKDDYQCGTYLAKNALDYINRLKAEKKQIRKDTAENFAETLIALLWEENKGETITIKDLHTVIKDVAKAQYGIRDWLKAERSESK